MANPGPTLYGIEVEHITLGPTLYGIEVEHITLGPTFMGLEIEHFRPLHGKNLKVESGTKKKEFSVGTKRKEFEQPTVS